MQKEHTGSFLFPELEYNAKRGFEKTIDIYKHMFYNNEHDRYSPAI